MEKYQPYFAAGAALTFMLGATKLRKDKLKNDEGKYDENKPQRNFKKYYRSNFHDNEKQLYSEEDFNLVLKKIDSLDLDKMLEVTPNVSLKEFSENNFEYIDQEKALNQMTTLILNEHKVIGIDIEQTNNNSYQGYNCLIQISTVSTCFIIDAIVLHDILPKYLKPICENEDIIKVFYSGFSDLQWLSRDYGIFVVNFFDIYLASSFVSKQKDCSLAGLLNEYCNYKISKEDKKKFQVSDWRKRPLSKEQLNYAVLDVFYLIYLRNLFVEKIKQSKQPEEVTLFLKKMQSFCLKTYETKPFNILPFAEHFHSELALYKRKHKEDEKKLKIDWGEEKKTFLKMCHLRDFLARQLDTNPELICSIDFLFNFSINLKALNINEVSSQISKNHESAGVLSGYVNYIIFFLENSPLKDLTIVENKKSLDNKEEEKLARKLKNEEKFTLQRKLYENCRVLAPDGELIAKTNRKKIAWYLNKNLGTLVVGEDPPTIKLNFEPSKRGRVELDELNIEKEDYLKNNRANQCVVCGQEEKLSKFHVVPVIYRQHFPEDLKSHRAHDVLLMCIRCRDKANAEVDKLKAEIAQRYNVPLIEFDRPQEIIQSVRCIQNVIFSYSKHKHSMPKDRRQKIKTQIREEFSSIYKDSYLSDDTKIVFESFEYKEEKVKINEEFVNYFSRQRNLRDFVQSSSNKDFKNLHGKIVVEKFKTVDELKDFIEEWRIQFINSMGPQFLPYDWKLALGGKKNSNDDESLSQN